MMSEVIVTQRSPAILRIVLMNASPNADLPHEVVRRVRRATLSELDAMNAVVARAIGTWDLAERVKRLVLPLYRYDAVDFRDFEILVAVDAPGVVGVAAWQMSREASEASGDEPSACLHGLYVDPEVQHCGIGTELLECAESQASREGCRALWTRAQRDAEAFFLRRGLLLCSEGDDAPPRRFVKPLRPPEQPALRGDRDVAMEG
jgi:GNAT superfamily N-acetyltransferase